MYIRTYVYEAKYMYFEKSKVWVVGVWSQG